MDFFFNPQGIAVVGATPNPLKGGNAILRNILLGYRGGIYPVIMKLGFDPIWFGIIIAITVMIGVVIPPVAMNVFVVKNITKVPFNIIYKGVYPFLISLVLCAALLFLFPQLATFLPNLLMK
jgi:TRAP-type C4-dicarboxylate transport system permease large subunit